MSNRRLLQIGMAALAAMLLSGCCYSHEIAQTRRDIERRYPGARFEREVVFTMGPGSLHSLSWLAGLSHDDDARFASALLADIHRIKVGVYRVEELPPLDRFDLSDIERFHRDGYEVAVRTTEEDERTWVLYREHRGSVRDLFVVVLDRDDLVVTRLQGRLDRLFEHVVAERGLPGFVRDVH